MNTEWKIPLISGTELPINIATGSSLFIVGPNGSGKSALIQQAVNTFGADNVRRISAHRQTWFQSGSIDMTPHSRRDFETSRRSQEPNDEYRWREWNPGGQLSSVLFDMTAADNDQARRIRDLAFAKELAAVDKIVESERPVFSQINDLLALAGLAVAIENSAGEEILARHRDYSAPYSVAHMSDGERNAVIIAANVLTVREGTVILLDEPERHLHRSIIEPFLSALFAERPDCAFVISTHEVGLPMANHEAKVLVVRSCKWGNRTPTGWDATLIEGNFELPEDLKRAILGARKRVLLVEGQAHSLDFRIYTALFPEISIVPVGSCDEVIKAVRGLRESHGLHEVEAFGLVDRDNREHPQVGVLEQQGIYSLDAYSVESLYYTEEAMTAVANRQAESLGKNAIQMTQEARQNGLDAAMQEGIAESMAARLCEESLNSGLRSRLPGWEQIRNNPNCVIELSAQSSYASELSHFLDLLKKGNIDAIIARYPVRYTNMLAEMVKVFDLNKKNYENTVITRIRSDASLAEKLRQRVQPLSDVLREQSDS